MPERSKGEIKPQPMGCGTKIQINSAMPFVISGAQDTMLKSGIFRLAALHLDLRSVADKNLKWMAA
jgi:hypothetical protein